MRRPSKCGGGRRSRRTVLAQSGRGPPHTAYRTPENRKRCGKQTDRQKRGGDGRQEVTSSPAWVSARPGSPGTAGGRASRPGCLWPSVRPCPSQADGAWQPQRPCGPKAAATSRDA